LGDIYFGDHRQWRDKDGIRYAEDVATYNENQILSVTKAAFELALKRDRRVCLVHKANVLEISRLWQDIVRDYAKSHPEVTLSEMLVDNCAMQLILKPAQFDVLLTSNLFGDILSDLASALPGSLGLTASASLNDQGYGLFEPAGGSAPDIAGQGIANPLAQILSLSLMLEIKFKLKHYAQAIRLACQKTLAQGIMTRDLSTSKYATTREFTDAVIKNLASR
jgi:3-isopropylmalate dehydrogenase